MWFGGHRSPGAKTVRGETNLGAQGEEEPALSAVDGRRGFPDLYVIPTRWLRLDAGQNDFGADAVLEVFPFIDGGNA